MDLDDTTGPVLSEPAPDGDLLGGVRDFLRGFERRQAERVVEFPGGFAVLSPRYAASHDHNKLCFRGAVTADDLADMERGGWRGALPDASPEVVEQLVDRRRARTRAADGVVFLAVRAGGEVVARADLYLDPARGLAQIEDVLTEEGHRDRGYAQALLRDATRRAHEAGCATRFLLAAADDWPQVLYGRLGYRVIGSRHLFARTA
ncbi:GNAT family N-acetyltransferase [Promicromonospora sp. NPDC090134]|uniref:GNAT family N-acetyltransferase n=1 Tax=Promicromonospora sp. NPDC090134 TaxID=3364408 RepID=UPI0037F783D0